jgi:hypothetical protein
MKMKTSATERQLRSKEAAQPDSPPWWTIRQVGAHHHVDDTTVRRWITQGLLTAVRVGPRLIRMARLLIGLGVIRSMRSVKH